MTHSWRARITPDLLDAVRDHYSIGWAADPVDMGGHNLNVHLPDDHVLRVYNPWTTQDRLQAIQFCRRALIAAGLPFIEPLRTSDGAHLVAFEGRVLEVEHFVSGERMNISNQLAAGMPILARIHDVLRDVSAPPAASGAARPNHVDAELALAWTKQGTEAMRSDGVAIDVADIADALASVIRPLELDLNGALPRQLVHGDFWDNNVLFGDTDVVAILDLDFMGERPRIDDLALTLYYTNSTLGSGYTSPERIEYLRRLVDAYDAGLEDKLSDAERAALPPALARTVLCFVGMIPLIESEQLRHKLIGEIEPDLRWSLELVSDIVRWQAGFG